MARLAAIADRRPLTPAEHLQLMQLLNQMRIVSNGLAQSNFEETWESLKNEKNREKRLPSLFSPKLIEFRNLIEGLLSQNVKVVIFSQWKRMLKLAHWAVEDLIADSQNESVFFTGQENIKKRTENIIRFHDEPNVRFFFATDAGGVGLNLQQAASVCINLELPWNPAVLEQRNSRIYRLGQTQPVQIFTLITKDSIEERIQTLVAKKQAVFSGLFDGTSDEVRFESGGGFYKQIQEITKDQSVDLRADEEDVSEPVLLESADSMDNSDTIQFAPEPEKKSPANLNAIAQDLKKSMSGIKVARDNGKLKIEAEGESAALLAQVFRGMAELFSGLE